MILKRSLGVYASKAWNLARMGFSGKVRLGENLYLIKTIGRRRMPIDLSYMGYENEFKIFLAKELGVKAGTFIDVGVNFGQTLSTVLSIDPNRDYLGIEPQPICVAEVNEFISRNNLVNVKILCACISDADGLVNLNFLSSGDVGASLIEEFRPKHALPLKQISVSLTGDNLIGDQQIEHVAIIKIDVEGAELEVLRSFEKTIKSMSPTIVFEILPHILVGTGEKLDPQTVEVRIQRERKIAEFLNEIGYDTYLLQPDGGEMRETVTSCANLKVRNYIARPRLIQNV